MPLAHRHATEADHHVVIELMREFYREEKLAFNEAAVARALLQILRDSSIGHVWLLQSGGAEEVIGYLVLVHSFILEFGGRMAYLDEFYLRPEVRGRGFGAEALRRVEEHCCAENIHVLRLEVDRSHHQAIRLYQRAGFLLQERFTMTRLLNQAGET